MDPPDFLGTNPREWNPEQLHHWTQQLGGEFASVAMKLKQRDVSGEDLYGCTLGDLTAIGISKLDAKFILKTFTDLARQI